MRAILENIHDDVDIFVNVDGYDIEVGGHFFNDEQGYLALIPIKEEQDDEEDIAAWEDDGGSADDSVCALPGYNPAAETTKIRDL